MIIYNSEINTDTKFVFTVSKNIKSKPCRNVIKRRMKATICTMYPHIKDNYYIAIIGKNKDATFQTLQEEITHILQSTDIYIK